MNDDLRLYKVIFEQTPVSTQIFTPDGETVLVNNAWKQLWKADFKSPPKYNILKDKQLVETGTMKYIKRAFKGKAVDLPEIMYEPAKSVSIKGLVPYRWLSARMYPIRNSNNKITHIVLQHEDITEYRNNEIALKTSEERLRLALDAGTIGVWDWNIKDDSLLWTENNYKMLGVSKDTFVLTYQNFISIVHPDDRKRFVNSVCKSVLTHRDLHIQFRVVDPEGNIHWVSTSATVLYDSKNRPERMLGATSDITQQKQADQDKSDFLSTASHELKTPITSLNMFVDLLKKEILKNNSEKALYYSDRVKDQTDRVVDLINDLLDVSRIETGKLKLKKEKFLLNDLVMETIEVLQATTQHQLIVRSSQKVKIYADKYRIYQVLVNLINNAIKYSPGSKKIIISVKKNKVAVVSVKDYGIGIAKSKQDKVFDRLYQVTGSTEKTYPGLGLGLYISKEIIDRHYGKIWLKSEKGKGSTFYFSLPLDEK